MFEFIALIVFLVSLSVVLFILARKMPALAKLPQNYSGGKISDISFIKKIKAHHFHLFEKQMLLHKLLSWVKVMTLKAETRIDHLLHGIRKKAQEMDKDVKNKQ